MLIPSTLRKDALIATDPDMLEMEYVRLVGDREMCSLPSPQEYAIYAADLVIWQQGFAGLVEEAAGLFSEIIQPRIYANLRESLYCPSSFFCFDRTSAFFPSGRQSKQVSKR